MDNISLIGIDIAKNVFHMRAVNHRGRAFVIVRFLDLNC